MLLLYMWELGWSRIGPSSYSCWFISLENLNLILVGFAFTLVVGFFSFLFFFLADHFCFGIVFFSLEPVKHLSPLNWLRSYLEHQHWKADCRKQVASFSDVDEIRFLWGRFVRTLWCSCFCWATPIILPELKT